MNSLIQFGGVKSSWFGYNSKMIQYHKEAKKKLMKFFCILFVNNLIFAFYSRIKCIIHFLCFIRCSVQKHKKMNYIRIIRELCYYSTNCQGRKDSQNVATEDQSCHVFKSLFKVFDRGLNAKPFFGFFFFFCLNNIRSLHIILLPWSIINYLRLTCTLGGFLKSNKFFYHKRSTNWLIDAWYFDI
jgi:hypothetical protein